MCKEFWALVETRNREERVAEAHAEQQGHQVYLPRYRKREYRDGRVISVAKVLFENYLFVKIRERWSHLSSTKGITRIVMASEGPARVPLPDIARLRAREDAEGYVVLQRAHPFQIGQKLQYVSGGTILEAIYEGLTDDDRVRVLFEILGRRVRAAVSVSELQIA